MRTTKFQIIATEAGIQLELKKALKEDQVKKLEKNFSEVKDFVGDKSSIITVIAQEKHIVLGMMLDQVITPAMLGQAMTQIDSLMTDTVNFLDDLPEDEKVLDEDIASDKFKDNAEKATDEAFESIMKAIPDAGVFITILDPKSGDIQMAGNLKKSFVLSTLLMNG